MATIRCCDWTKKKLGKDDTTYVLRLDGKEYEICKEALEELRAFLDSEESPLNRLAQSAPLKPQFVHVTPPAVVPAINIVPNQEAPAPPQEMPEPPGEIPTPPPAPITLPPIPASIRERLPVPSPAQSDAVLAESVRFEEGTLRALTPGKARTQAQERLKTKWEDKFEDTHRPLPERARGRGEE